MYIVVRYWDEGCVVEAFRTFEEAYEYMKEDFKSILMEYNCVLDDESDVYDSERNRLEETFITKFTAQFCSKEERFNWVIHCVAVA